ncbi:MAG: bacterial Ig-like domain-containing protein [Clostridia bacterium]|nr:bacterial Ig-like domain-containing protein [Clostridia bacterium]
MRNNRKKSIMKVLFFIILLGIILIQTQVFAKSENPIEKFTKQEYTEEYKEWLELPEDERNNRLEPRRFDVKYETSYSTYLKGINNKIKVAELLKSSSNTYYNLKDYISKSVKIKNQEQTNMCWAFAGTATLESHLALKHYKSTNEDIEYDFSERHMAYSAANKSLLNSTNNLYAFNSSVSDGGNYFMVEQYLSTGNGAILDEDMPFENTERSIDISVVQSKKDIVTTLLDTTLFETDSQTTNAELIAQMKSYITNYGGIYAGIHGAQIMSDYYNNETGAIYCNNSYSAPMNHAILIIGWDDNFNKPTDDENYVNKFNSNCVPDSYGAWIIKNSWGDYMTESLSKFKTSLYEANKSYFNQQGCNSAEEISNEFILELLKEEYGETKVSIGAASDTITLEVGNKGYMYVSYDDVNVYDYLWGIENAKDGVDYDNIYQHDHLGSSSAIQASVGTNAPMYMANVFSRDIQKDEELTKISLYTDQEYICKVKVNPNGSSLDANLEEATLAKGNSDNTINIKPGYHTIEFAEPIELTGNTFAVVVEITNSSYYKYVSIERPIPDTTFANAVVNENESFVSTDGTTWVDTTDLAEQECDGNVTIKAFTNNISEIQQPDEPTEEPDPEPEALELQEIRIAQVPDTVTYYVGDNFDATGMVVKAIYSNSARQEERDITNAITIINGANLQLGQTTVTISYTDGEITKTTTQSIVVQEEIIEEPDDEQPEEKQPILSDFDNSKAMLIDMEISGVNENGYYTMTLNINGINKGDEESEYKYYWYISGTQGESNIKDEYWTEITLDNMTKQSDGTYSLKINIDSRTLPNISQLMNSDNLYLYIKEIATLDGNSKSQIVTKAIEIDLKVEEDISDKINGTINNSQNKEDDTTASGDLPNAGLSIAIILMIIAVIVIAVFAYNRFKYLDI